MNSFIKKWASEAKCLTFSISLIYLSLFFTSQVLSQETETGEISGIVRIENVMSLQGVGVSISGSSARTFTDSNGRYILRNVPIGKKEIVFSYPMAKNVIESVDLKSDERVQIDVNLIAIEGQNKTLDEIIVTGDGRQMSLYAERASIGKKSIVASSKIGKFPDINAAEAVSRLPGVYMDLADHGEGRFVSVRGANPSFNRIKLNGMSLGSPELNGLSLPLDVFPAGQIAEIQVTKSTLPSEDANSIGGEINLISPTAFDKEPTQSFKVTYGQAEIGRNTDRYGGEYLMSRVFGDQEQYGFTLSAHYDKRENTLEAIRVPDWDLTDDISGYGDLYIIDSMELRNYENARENSSFSMFLEWKPSDFTKLYFQASLNKFEEDELRHRYRQEIDDGGDVVDDGSAIITAVTGSSEDTVSRVTLEDIGGTTRDMQHDMTPQEIEIFSFGGETQLKDWNTTYKIGIADTTELRTIDFVEFRQNSGTTLTFDSTGNPYLPLLTHVAGPDPSDPDEYYLRQVHDNQSFRLDEVTTLDGNAKRSINLDNGDVFELFLGARATLRDRGRDEESVRWKDRPSGHPKLLLSDPRVLRLNTNSNLLNTYNYGPSISLSGLELLHADPGSELRFRADDSNVRGHIKDYTADEKVHAGFIQGTYFSGPYTLLIGGRVERTSLELSGYGVTDDDDIVEFNNKNIYSDFFPSAHFRWDINDDVIFRASYAETLSRPNFYDLAPSAEIDLDDQEIEVGNPDLEPHYSKNIDVSIDWYSDQYGIFSVGLFYKDIDGFVIGTEDTVVGGPYNGFSRESYENAEGGKIKGIELSYTRQFSELTGFWSDVGLSMNFTSIDSEVDFPPEGPSERRVPNLNVALLGQADKSGDFALWYEGEKLFVQVAYAMVGDFIVSYADSHEDRHNAGSDWLSLKAIYNLSERSSVQFNWANINDQRMELFLGDKSRLRDYERSGQYIDLQYTMNF
jgi:TonB-dependent receptor